MRPDSRTGELYSSSIESKAMDREPKELQFMAMLEIYKESFKIISSWRKLFTKITLALILPLTFFFLVCIHVSELILTNIVQNYLLHDPISSEWIILWLFEVAYLGFLLIFSILSTSAIVYSIASIYTAKEVTFKKVMTVVPKVCKRLMSSFLWGFIIVFLYNFVAMVVFLALIIKFFLSGLLGFIIGSVLITVVVAFYLYGLSYISIVWYLASVITVLEDFKGIHEAMIKSKDLIKGKMRDGRGIFCALFSVFLLVLIQFERLVVHGEKLGMGFRVLSGMVCFLLLIQLFLLGLVVQSVFYFVCKSYHHENINKSLLADHLGVYDNVGGYEPLKDKDVQLEQYDV